MRTRGVLGVVAVMSVVAFGVSACGGEGSSQPGSVAVTMTGSALGVEPASLPHGLVTFDVHNEGHHAMHRMIVVRSDLPAAELPVIDGVEFDLTGLEVMGEVEGIAAEAGGVLSVQLEAGHYLIVCEMEGHDHSSWFAADLDVSH